MTQAHAVYAFRPPDVGGAVPADRNGFIGRQDARHAGNPEHLVAPLGQCAVYEAVDRREFVQGCFDLLVRSGDQFDLRFAEVCRDGRVREGRAQHGRVRSQGQGAIELRTETFLLDPAAHSTELRMGKAVQVLEVDAH